MNNQVSHLALLCCAFPFVATACGGESPTEGEVVEVVEVVEGSFLSVAGDGQVGSLGNPLTDSLVVRVADASGNGVPGVAVRWSVNSPVSPVGNPRDRFSLSYGFVNRITIVTDSEGLAKVQWTLGRVTGEETATEQMATATAPVRGETLINFTATTPSLVPLTDMGASTYFGFPGGLYPGGNVMPQAHADAGQAAAAAIEPLDVNGDPAPNGKYVLLSIGASITTNIYCTTRLEHGPCPSYTLVGKVLADADVDSNLAVIGGARGVKDAEFWEWPDSPDYDDIRDTKLNIRGLSEQQVQAVWLHTITDESLFSPDVGVQADRLVGKLGNIVRALRIRYPNLRLVFLGNHAYMGYVFRQRAVLRADRLRGRLQNEVADPGAD